MERHIVDEDELTITLSIDGLEHLGKSPMGPPGGELLGVCTSRGLVETAWWGEPDDARCCVMVPGAIGGWHSPSNGLYDVLCRELPELGFAAIRTRFRDPHDLDEATLDVIATLTVAFERGVTTAALIGHSFGGAVVIRTAAATPRVDHVVALAPQSFGAEGARQLRAPTSLLLLHGTRDHLLPVSCSRQIRAWSGCPTEMEVYAENDHNLDESAGDVLERVRGFLLGLGKG